MISIIIPFYNEEESLPVLIKQLNKDYEVILINDGSTDQGLEKLKNLPSNFKLLTHRRHFGKGRALMTGFQAAKGDIIVFMDADLQDDPNELPKFVKTIEKGYDFVNGWRLERKDPLSKRLPSYIFNTLLLQLFFRSKFHDINCGYKAMKRQVIEEIPLYGDNYRFLPLMAEQAGFRTTEVEIKHHPRKFGRSKYGFFRLLFGFLDTVTTYFVYRFSEKPLHFFGPIGSVFLGLGFLISLYLAIERIFFNVLLYRRPALLLGVLLIIVGLQIVMTGIIAELVVYLNQKNKK